MHTTRFCIVRHGETDWNRERRLQGHLDIPLNRQGEEQALRLATALQLRGQRFDSLHVSSLTRTRQTAAPLMDKLKLTAQFHDALKERHYGAFQGKTYDEARAAMPEAWRKHQDRDPHYDMDGGETLQGFHQRIISHINRLAEAHPAQTVLVVAHGGVLEMIYRHATGTPLQKPRDFPIPNAALNWLSVGPQGWVLEKWADESHLAETLDEL